MYEDKTTPSSFVAEGATILLETATASDETDEKHLSSTSEFVMTIYIICLPLLLLAYYFISSEESNKRAANSDKYVKNVTQEEDKQDTGDVSDLSE